MAEINHTITLGIGTPGAIPEFLTFGLQIGEVAGVIAAFGFIFSPGNAGTVQSPPANNDILSPDGTGTIKSDRYG
jgi:hypothetical protein